MRLSAAAAVWGAGLSLACAQESGQNVPNQGPRLEQTMPPTAPGAADEPVPGSPMGADTTDEAALQGSPAEHGTLSPTRGSEFTTTPRTSTFSIVDPNEPRIDARTVRTTRPNRPLLGASSALFVASYLPTIIYQAVDDRNDNLYIPIAGPWMDIADKHQDTASKTLFAMSGVAQGLGALGIVSSFFVPERRTRRWHLLGGRTRQAFSVAPTMARGTYGLGAMGRF
jgi:hypothetical protein